MIFTNDMVQPLREKMQLSRYDFAHEVGVTERTVCNWETSDQPRKIQRAVRNNLIKLQKKWVIS